MKHIDVAIAVILRRTRVLVCQRKQEDSFGGFWEFPGGKREEGETLEQCLARELIEELDIIVKPIEKLSPVQHHYPQVHLTLHPFLCDYISGELKLIECQRAIWINPIELRNYRFPPANESLIEEVIRRLTPIDAPS